MAVKEKTADTIVITPVVQKRARAWVIGTSPLIFNGYSDAARQELLLPSGRKTAAALAARPKHDPVGEFQGSIYELPAGPTLLGLPAGAFKGAMAVAALDLPDTTKTRVGRLISIVGDYVSVYGTPQILMSMVRNSDVKRTPDVRTRAILPEWVATIEIDFVEPLLNTQAVYNLLAAGGVTVGVGDWRPEKGKGRYGQFRLINENEDADADRIIKQGREAQKTAMTNPSPYDMQTAKLLSWHRAEIKTKSFATAKTGPAA